MSLSVNGDVLVIGAGAMGAGIAQVAATAGRRVFLYDLRDGAAKSAAEKIGVDLEKLVAKGRLPARQREDILARLVVSETLDDLSGISLVIEAIKEDLDAKRALFAEIESRVANDTVLTTNTSSISVTAIAAALSRPERFAGLHFFNPAPLMPLVEVVSGLATDPELIESLVETMVAWEKIPVTATSTPGFIVNRVARPFYGEALRVLNERAGDPATLDAIMREAGGFRMGPFELMDLIGHDVNLAVTRSVHASYFGDPRYAPSLLQQELVAAGRLGRKSGRGFFDYAPGAKGPAPAQAPPAAAPAEIVIQGPLGPAQPFARLIEEAGLPLSQTGGDGLIVIPGLVTLALTDGRPATIRAAQDGLPDLVLFDLALDFASASRIAIASADQARPASVIAAAGLFQAVGKTVSVLDDIPGLIVARTVAMLAHEGADAVNQGVATAATIDLAMRKGVNYPAGPLAWADALTPALVERIVDNLADAYGEDRYRTSPLIRRLAARNALFHGDHA